MRKTKNGRNNFVLIGGQNIEIKKIPVQKGLELLFSGAPLFGKIVGQLTLEDFSKLAQENTAILIDIVAACAERESWWIAQNASLPQLIEALLVADNLNGFTLAFGYIRAMGWVE